jgi:glycosyltransferase involved in cell wall biosynthesis
MGSQQVDRKAKDKSPAALWVGAVPAHYMRQLHTDVQLKAPEGIEFLYVSPPHGFNERSYETGYLPDKHKVVPRNGVMQLWRAMGEARPQLVCIAGYKPLLLLIAFLWAILHRRHIAYMSDTNLISVLRDNFIRRFVSRYVGKLLLRHVNTYLFIGTRNRDYYTYVLGRYTAKHRFLQLPYPAISPSITEPVGSDPDLLKLLFVGRLVTEKAVDKLIEAMALLPSHVATNTRLTIVGDGKCRQYLEMLCHKKRLSQRVHFVGAVSSNSVGDFFSTHDLFVLPSDREPWGLVVNEALLAGLPVAAPYWVGAATDLLVPGHSGFVLYDNSPETIAMAIVEAFLLGRSQLKRMGTNGREIVLAGGFHLDSATKTFCKLLADHTDAKVPA